MPHTPGPWVAQRDWESVYSPDPEELEAYMKRPITAIRSITADKDVALCHDLFEFNPDDAALIAAAPDLLEALENIMGAIDTPVGRLRLKAGSGSFISEAMDIARATIAKAKGVTK